MAADPDVTPVRFTVEQYERMGETTILDPDARYELLDGVITMMSPSGPLHAGTVDQIATQATYRLYGLATVRVQNPIRLGDHSEPQPDIVIARLRRDFYKSAHPTAEDTHVAIEVSDSTLRTDRLVKLPIYATQCVGEVWIVDVHARTIEVYRQPVGRTYTDAGMYRDDEPFTPAAFPNVAFTARELLGDG
jgi:Uma2 family endonuclease